MRQVGGAGLTAGSAHQAPGRRLAKADRRAQLLDVALAIVREEGADSLTLGNLAARAGVSKPIAYEHFGTRAGLLVALYRSIDAAQVEALRHALAQAPRGLKEAADLIARAYMHCYADSSGEWHAVAGALKGSGEMEAVQQELLEDYVDLFRAALSPYSPMTRTASACAVPRWWVLPRRSRARWSAARSTRRTPRARWPT